MTLTLFAVSQRDRKAYKDDTGLLYLECTGCKAIKNEYNFTSDKKGFQGKYSNCLDCRNKIHRRYRQSEAYTKYYK
jgi:hypothetical protein